LPAADGLSSPGQRKGVGFAVFASEANKQLIGLVPPKIKLWLRHLSAFVFKPAPAIRETTDDAWEPWKL
jgi:hypothetical protein